MRDLPRKPYKAREFREARRLRRELGMPIKLIASRLDVSPATVHNWTTDIELTPMQVERNYRRGRSTFADTWMEKNRARRRQFQQRGRIRAGRVEPLHMAGCMLYWAEGSKHRNCAKLTNSDLHMVRFFRRFLSECFAVPTERFSIRLNLYLGNGLSIAEVEDHWLRSLELPRTCLRKHSIDHLPTSSSGRKKNRLPYGVCTLTVCSTEIVQHIYGAIQEYAGFEEPAWLDGPPRRPHESKQATLVAQQ